jgi:alpha-mannosidase
LDLHVVPHTHWDREWYHPVERFRQRLVALVDELIDDPPRDDESFLLDGQTIVIDDYLAVRPDRADRLHALLRAGRLEAGPWFVLADELIPSGEALVRNLLTGRRTLRRIGVEPPPVLYCPDSFGHPAVLPSIAAGFGLPLIILWRGFGGARSPMTDVVRWASPGGDEALVYHLPRDGYEFGSHLPLDPSAAAARWQRIRAELEPRSATGVELLPNGADHHARQARFGDALALLANVAAPDRVHASSLRAFAEHLVGEARAKRGDLPVVRGELRDSYGYTWTLQGTFGTRAHEKRMNARAERLLLREAEPWVALASRVGPSGRPLVEAAWRTLLEAHPHDTLCGCSIDDVAEAMELRIRSATNQGIGDRA